MSEELLSSNDRPVEEHLTPPWFEPLTRFIIIYTTHCTIWPLYFLCRNWLCISNKLYFEVRAIEIPQNEERKRQNVTWEVKECSRRKAKYAQAKNLHKKERYVYSNCYELRSSN